MRLRTPISAGAWPAAGRILLIVLLAMLIWIVHFERWTVESWRVPTDYFGDAPEALARLKAAAEGDMWPLRSQVISRLGAPFGADWNAYPAPDKPLMLLLGACVHAIGLHAAANLGLVLAQVTAALAFYGVARWLRFRWEWSAAGALLFAYTYHTFHRGLAHFSLVFTWTVPLGLAIVWLIAGSRRIEWRRPAAGLCLAGGAALGMFNPYNLLFWLQLMGWALVWQWFGARRRVNLGIGLATIAVALIAFAVANAELWLHVDNPDAQPLLARNYGGTEIYALKPVEMFIPPSYHHWDFLAFFGQRYARWSPWRGEAFLPYLGLAGIAGFAWLAWVTVRRMMVRRPPPGQALTIGWIVAYAAVGGVTNLLALFAGFQVFRATNRAAIFISAIVLFFLVGRLSRLSARWPAWMRACAAGVMGLVGVCDQMPKLEKDLDPTAIAAQVAADAAFGRELERVLPENTMVFQLPVVSFPEAEAIYQLGEYEHFRPYLATDTLRFSFGATKLRARSRWQRELQALPLPELVSRLEDYGFGAVYLNRKGFADGGEQVLHELAALGCTQRVESGGDQIAVVLRPAHDTIPPVASGMTYGVGWQPRAEEGWRWAYDDAALAYFNPYDHPIFVELRLEVRADGERELQLEHEDSVIRRVHLKGTPEALVISRVELEPGVNRFKLSSDAPPVRRHEGRNQLRAFGVAEKSVRVVVQNTAPPLPEFARLGQL